MSDCIVTVDKIKMLKYFCTVPGRSWRIAHTSDEVIPTSLIFWLELNYDLQRGVFKLQVLLFLLTS